MFNPEPIVGDVNMTGLASGLTDASSFAVTYSGNATFEEYADFVFDFGHDESEKPPYMYGSY